MVLLLFLFSQAAWKKKDSVPSREGLRGCREGENDEGNIICPPTH